MKKMTKVAVFITASFAASSASASDWNVTQAASITVAAPSITQGATTNVVSSNQAVNGIVLATGDDLLTGSQTATIGSSAGIVLTQGGNVDSSNQAINLIQANGIGATSEITQTVTQTGTSTTALTQEDLDATGGNVQAANLSDATGNIVHLSQTYAESDSVALVQSSVVSAANTQGVNYATAGDSIGNATMGLTQSVTVTNAASFTQGAGNVGGNNVQVGNGAVAKGAMGAILNTVQTFTVSAANLDLTQSAGSAGSNTQAVNMISATGANSTINTGTAQTVTVTAGDTNFLQDTSSTDNTQAGNLANAAGDIDQLAQTFSASGANEVDFDQVPTAASNRQAGNMAALTGAGAITDILQVFTSSTTTTDLNQTSTSGTLIQAGNLIDLGTGSITDAGVTQQFDALGGAVAMTQAGAATGNLQALNGIVYDNTGADSTVSQALTITATTFAMSQDAVTSSGQYGNFVGVKYN
ncbi:MAG: hypothetical protein ACI8XV_002209 [Arenicella sp.]|jgi:hypothetical protein